MLRGSKLLFVLTGTSLLPSRRLGDAQTVHPFENLMDNCLYLMDCDSST